MSILDKLESEVSSMDVARVFDELKSRAVRIANQYASNPRDAYTRELKIILSDVERLLSSWDRELLRDDPSQIVKNLRSLYAEVNSEQCSLSDLAIWNLYDQYYYCDGDTDFLTVKAMRVL